MKHKILGIIVCLVVVLASVLIQFRPVAAGGRIHQHLEATPKAPCTDHGADEFCTHLPLVRIETGGVTIPGAVTGERDRFGEAVYTTAEDGESMVKVSVSVFDSKEENNHLTDSPVFMTDSMIRVRGHMSREFEKAPYLLKFIDENGENKKISVMGMGAHHEWILNGPYLDKSLLRNYLFYNLAGEMMDYAPNVRFCELFVDGDYRGIYLMMESISNGDSRLNLTVTEKGQNVTGYLYRIDRIAEEELGTVREIYPLCERNGLLDHDITIRYPGKDTLTEKLAREIELEISSFDKALDSYDYSSDKHGYRNYFDLNNAVDYFLINELCSNTDAGKYSTYVYKRPRDKYRFCVWDFNNACDNNNVEKSGIEGFFMPNRMYYRSFCMDKKFTSTLIRRYKELRKTILSDEYLHTYMRDAIDYLGPAIERNTERWRTYIESDQLTPKELNVHSQREAAEALEAWLVARMDWMDRNIETLLQYSADSRIRKFNEVSGK